MANNEKWKPPIYKVIPLRADIDLNLRLYLTSCNKRVVYHVNAFLCYELGYHFHLFMLHTPLFS